jgi:tRNA-2-methylthio-N6-dimethylallyladenosine synthase
MQDDVPPHEKMRRFRALEELQAEIAGGINSALVGRKLEVLVEGKQRGKWKGRTRTNKLVFFESEGDWHGQLVPVEITWAGPWSMQANLLADGERLAFRSKQVARRPSTLSTP